LAALETIQRHGERKLALRWDFHRNLVGGATNAAGLDFKAGLDVFEGLGQDIERIASLLFSFTESIAP